MNIKKQKGVAPVPSYGWDYDAWGKDAKGGIYHLKYNRWFPAELEVDAAFIELKAFLEAWSVESGGLGKFEHAKRAVDLLWNTREDGLKMFVWTPEALKMTEEACRYEMTDETSCHRYLGICGASSCGKSHWAAMWSLLNFYADPEHTMVLVTSTSIQAAKQRVWGSVQRLWSELPPEYRAKSKMVGANGILRYREVDDTKAQTDTRGITLVAAEQKNDKDAVQKLIGRKQKRMFLIADELPELSASINTAAKGNLVNNPAFQYIALGNPKSYFDAFGDFCKPPGGWSTVSELDYEWDLRNGKVIRFDALKSTNYVTGERIYPFNPSKQDVEDARAEFGENSLTFYRMYRGFFPPQGSSDAIYPAIELMMKNQPAVKDWAKDGFILTAGLDISFVSGGDKTVLTILKAGRTVAGKNMVEHYKCYVIKENIMLKEETRTSQICQEIKRILMLEGVELHNFAYDSTGGGAPFGDVLSIVLNSREMLPVQFAERPSDRKGSGTDRRPAHERYANRMAEIWYQGKEFLRGGQLACLPDDLMNEMSQRTYTTGNRGKITVQPKSEIKSLTGKSPDLSDSFFLALEVCCRRLRFTGEERLQFSLTDDAYIETLQSLDLVTLSNKGMADWSPAA